jgi:hypothetical protein
MASIVYSKQAKSSNGNVYYPFGMYHDYENLNHAVKIRLTSLLSVSQVVIVIAGYKGCVSTLERIAKNHQGVLQRIQGHCNWQIIVNHQVL